MNKRFRKYTVIIAILALWGQMVFSTSMQLGHDSDFLRDDSLSNYDTKDAVKNVSGDTSLAKNQIVSILDTTKMLQLPPMSGTVDTTSMIQLPALPVVNDTILPEPEHQSTKQDSQNVKKASFLDDVISGKNKDSLVYDVRNRVVYIYKDGDINYQEMNLKADYMRLMMDTKEIYAHGISDTTGNKTRPEFLDKGSTYTMDTITYNIKSGKAKIKGMSTQEGEGFIHSTVVKKMPDNSIHTGKGWYTTCDHVDHPHFCLEMTKSKMIPGKKMIIGYSYLQIEDVPIYFLGIPFGFFPINAERTSGFIVPQYGEMAEKGFYIRDGGYYFSFNDYMDLRLTGGIYTLGSWETKANSQYIKRYKFRGGFDVNFTKNIIGEKGTKSYSSGNSFSVAWMHQQDPKFKPNSTFSANVNFSTSGYNQYGTTNPYEGLQSQTSSSISYSKNWAGKPYSFSTNLRQSQNNRDSTWALTLPSATFSVSRIFPFQRKQAVGKTRWYEKISMNYTGTFENDVSVKEKDLFSKTMVDKMRYGFNHVIPISTSFNLLKYINISPNANYNERWYFEKIEKKWDEELKSIVNSDTTKGFYRIYNYSVSASATTKVYTTFQFKSKTFPVQAIRHVLTPSISLSYTPNFGDAKYGFYKPIQSDSTGTISYYSPFESGRYGLPGRSESASINFSVANTLEMKVIDKSDSTKLKKKKIIEDFSFSGSYNFLADSINLSDISLRLRTASLFKNFALNLSATLCPYEVNEKGQPINKFTLKRGSIGWIKQTSWAFSHSFNGGKSKTGQPAMNNMSSGGGLNPSQDAFFSDPANRIDPNTRREMMSSTYYDFSIPWNLGFSYNIRYSNNGVKKDISQDMNFNGSINLTPKWGITFGAGYDIKHKKLTPGAFNLTRDLHCWQMTFNMVPVGRQKSWSFEIRVKSGVLQDLKYDKKTSHYDSIHDIID